MTWFGLKQAVVAPLVRAITPDEVTARGEVADGDAGAGRSSADLGILGTSSVLERFARATWTGIAEPGDRVAGVLVRMLGAEQSLTAVLERWPIERVIAELSERGMPDDLAPADLASAFDRWRPRLRSSVALLSLEQAARLGVRLLVPGDPAWPSGVDDLGDHAPIALWLRGNTATLATHWSSIALVGARAATAYGENVAMEASAGLVDRGYTIVSGAAYGIDGMAHRAALASSGQTIAFLAGGVDRFYPTGHDALLTRIAEAGAVVSELPCGSPPTKWRFLQRNRLIAATSLATIVLEAGWRSGSLNTAGHASALGRPLGAVPGSVTSAASSGCHRLIREFDAVLVTDADEMAQLAPLSMLLPPRPTMRAIGAGPTPAGAGSTIEAPSASADLREAQPTSDSVRVLDALNARSARSVDDIAVRSGLSVATVRSVLGPLELEGRVTARESGWVIR